VPSIFVIFLLMDVRPRVSTRRASADLVIAGEEHRRRHPRSRAASLSHALDVERAVTHVLSADPADHMSYRTAARTFNVSVGSIQTGVARVADGRPARPSHAGAATALTDREEKYIVEVIFNFAAQDMCLGKEDLQQIVDFVSVGRRVGHNRVPLKLTKHWRAGFLRRHPEIHYGHCRPLQRQYIITQETVEEMRNLYKEFNEYVDRYGIRSDQVLALDEVGLTAKPEDSAHGKVFHPVSMPPKRLVRALNPHASLLAIIRCSGDPIVPVVVHPIQKVKPAHSEAFDKAAGVRAYHVPSGTSQSGSMTEELYSSSLQKHLFPCLSTWKPYLILHDGASCHWSPDLLLAARRDLMRSGEPIFFFRYPSNLSIHVAPPDDRAVFGAFQRTRRQKMFVESGPESKSDVMRMAGEAYKKNFRRDQIRAAFQSRGFEPSPQLRRNAQNKLLSGLQAHVDARSWAEKQIEDGALPRSLLSLTTFGGRLKKCVERRPLGAGAKHVGVINCDRNVLLIKVALAKRKRPPVALVDAGERRLKTPPKKRNLAPISA